MNIGEAHRRYTLLDAREGWRGHLWQGRFASAVLDEGHLLAAVRYLERNPVRAGLVASAEKWPWSMAYGMTLKMVVSFPQAAHLKGKLAEIDAKLQAIE